MTRQSCSAAHLLRCKFANPSVIIRRPLHHRQTAGGRAELLAGWESTVSVSGTVSVRQRAPTVSPHLGGACTPVAAPQPAGFSPDIFRPGTFSYATNKLSFCVVPRHEEPPRHGGHDSTRPAENRRFAFHKHLISFAAVGDTGATATN